LQQGQQVCSKAARSGTTKATHACSKATITTIATTTTTTAAAAAATTTTAAAATATATTTNTAAAATTVFLSMHLDHASQRF
jgi:hypothetical protein